MNLSRLRPGGPQAVTSTWRGLGAGMLPRRTTAAPRGANPNEDAMSQQYYVTVEIKPNDEVEVIRIEAAQTLEHAHDGACGHVHFMRRVNQRKRPYGKLETKPLLLALVSWPLPVLKTIIGMRHGFVGQEEADMARGLRSLKDDDADLVNAINRCALNEASDDDRILLARKSKDGQTMIGPGELVPCDKHQGEFHVFRWTWDVPEDGDHRSSLEAGEAFYVRDCPTCEAEDVARLQAEIEGEG